MAGIEDRVFVFGWATFDAALADWVAEQIAAYPQREELIRITALAMRDFMGSSQVARHKMILPAPRQGSVAD